MRIVRHCVSIELELMIIRQLPLVTGLREINPNCFEVIQAQDCDALNEDVINEYAKGEMPRSFDEAKTVGTKVMPHQLICGFGFGIV
jgi:hypothetical protein